MLYEICFYMCRNVYKIYKNDKVEMFYEVYFIFIKMYMYIVLWCIEKKFNMNRKIVKV